MPLPVHIFRVLNEKTGHLLLAPSANDEIGIKQLAGTKSQKLFPKIIVHEFGTNSTPLNLDEVIRTLQEPILPFSRFRPQSRFEILQ